MLFENMEDELDNITGNAGINGQMLQISFAYGTTVILAVFVFNVGLAFLFNKLHKKFSSEMDNMDVDFDAGGQVSTGLTATSVVAQWTWAATLLQSSGVASKYGISGAFWYASGATIQILLFSILSVKFKCHCPGAKTFLQLILCRFTSGTHKVYVVYALLTNLIVTGMLMLGGAQVLKALIEGYSIEMAALMCAVVIGVYTQIGGLGATFYVSYFNTIVIFSGIVSMCYKIFYAGDFHDDGCPLGSIERIYALVNQTVGPEGNTQYSYLTFLSQGGLSFGIINIVGNFGTVFVDQSYYQSAIAAKPKQSSLGFLAGGLVWFAVPFTFATSMGLAYIALSAHEGQSLLTDNEVSSGLLPVAVVSRMGGNIWIVMLMMMMLMAVTSTGAAEVMAIGSILVYDIHMVYLKPFRPETNFKRCLLCGALKKTGKEHKKCTCVSMGDCKYCRNDNRERRLIKRGMEPAYSCPSHGKYRLYMDFVKHRKSMCMTVSAISTIPIAMILQGFEITLGWVYLGMGVAIGSAVIPVVLAITWKKVTSQGMIVGPILGTVAGVISWLAVADTYPGGLSDFFANTGQEMSMLVGNLVSIIVGGFGAIATSILTVSKITNEEVEDTWEETLNIDNPLYPWVDLFNKELQLKFTNKSRPSILAITNAFRKSYLIATIGAVGSTAILIFVWPGFACLSGVFSISEFKIWVNVSFAWAVIALIYIAGAPFISEISIQYRRQKAARTEITTATTLVSTRRHSLIDA